jgi:hypothetical protein
MERTATSYPEVLGSLIPFHQGPLNLTRKCNSYRFRVPDGPSEARNSRSYVIDHKCLQYCLYIQIHCIAHFKKTILQLENKTPKWIYNCNAMSSIKCSWPLLRWWLPSWYVGSITVENRICHRLQDGQKMSCTRFDAEAGYFAARSFSTAKNFVHSRRRTSSHGHWGLQFDVRMDSQSLPGSGCAYFFWRNPLQLQYNVRKQWITSTNTSAIVWG